MSGFNQNMSNTNSSFLPSLDSTSKQNSLFLTNKSTFSNYKSKPRDLKLFNKIKKMDVNKYYPSTYLVDKVLTDKLYLPVDAKAMAIKSINEKNKFINKNKIYISPFNHTRSKTNLKQNENGENSKNNTYKTSLDFRLQDYTKILNTNENSLTEDHIE